MINVLYLVNNNIYESDNTSKFEMNNNSNKYIIDNTGFEINNETDKPNYKINNEFYVAGDSAHRDKDIKKVAKDLVGFKIKPDKIKIKLKFSRFAGGHLYETPISKRQTITKTRDGYLMVEDSVNNDMELRFWIRAFGGEVEVMKPKSLRDEFTQLSRRIGRMYAKS